MSTEQTLLKLIALEPAPLRDIVLATGWPSQTTLGALHRLCEQRRIRRIQRGRGYWYALPADTTTEQITGGNGPKSHRPSGARCQGASSPPTNKESHMEEIVQRRVDARGTTPPVTTAPASAFDLGRQAKEAAKAARALRGSSRIDAGAIQIRKHVPIPPAARPENSGYKALLEKMEPGDSVELPVRQFYGLKSVAKKHGISIISRKLGDDLYGVWKQ